jgi:hypothetical protein
MGVVPEAIFMYDASTMEVVMANTELEKLVSNWLQMWSLLLVKPF